MPVLSKQALREEFSRDYRKHYELEVFREKGFNRRKCPTCGRYFWSISREDCGDASHTPYSFLHKRNSEDYTGFWKKFASFFERNKHAVVQRYPVVSRWRPDLYFTMASIQDFQRLEKGKMSFEYPANPLVVPQISLRFNDIANVGVTGRHFSCFTMAGQHAFNYPKEGYWKDECIRLNFEFLTRELGVKPEELTYIEDVWAMGDFSAFGPCMESYSGGLELVNSVFMQYGLEKGARKELGMKVIDVGWGLERLLWYYNGDQTAFDSVFPKELELMEKRSHFELDRSLFQKYASISSALDVDEVKSLKEEEEKIAAALGIPVDEMKKKILPLQAMYAFADHSRTLLFALADGSLPSNVSGGYNLRVVLRRVLSFIEEFGFDFTLADIMESEARGLKDLYPELLENMESARAIIEIENKRYAESKSSARKIVAGMLEKNEKLTTEKMLQLYESNGITPELIEKVADEMKKDVSLPTEFYKKLVKEKFAEGEEKKPVLEFDVAGISATKQLYYKNLTECDANVLDVKGDLVVLDQTVFYPEGGGQAYDSGTIDGKQVLLVEKIGEVIVHKLKAGDAGVLKKGAKVKCVVDAERRARLMRHHTATHVIGAACRRVLGKHVWQAGARKEPDRAHLDITHYEKLTPEQVQQIERLANKIVLEAHPVTIKVYDRGEAEKKYGFTLYQGGGSPGKRVRVIDIDGIDAQACAGLHVDNTGKIGLIKIIKDERVQDGIDRIEFAAGSAALEFIQAREESFARAGEKLKVSIDKLPATAEKFFEEWKKASKLSDEYAERLALAEAERLRASAKGKDVRAVVDVDADMLLKLALKIIDIDSHATAVLSNKNNDLVTACGKESGKKAGDLLKEITKKFGGSGGGNDRFARGRTKEKVEF
ncbi:MAG: alanine--tRNA ligase [Candidatus Micrarchaeota archaeon]